MQVLLFLSITAQQPASPPPPPPAPGKRTIESTGTVAGTARLRVRVPTAPDPVPGGRFYGESPQPGGRLQVLGAEGGFRLRYARMAIPAQMKNAGTIRMTMAVIVACMAGEFRARRSAGAAGETRRARSDPSRRPRSRPRGSRST